MTPTKIAILALAFIGLALVLAIVINRVSRWWKFRKIRQAMETPTKRNSQMPPLRNPGPLPGQISPDPRERKIILPPHKSAARPSNVRKLKSPMVEPKEPWPRA